MFKENKPTTTANNGVDLLKADTSFNFISNSVNSQSNQSKNTLPNIGNTLVSDLWQ